MHINRVYMHIWVHFFIYTVAMDISGMRYCNLLTILYILKMSATCVFFVVNKLH